MISDRELIRLYAEQGEEAAFTEVVRRQTNFVYSAALRVTNNAPLAQDVTQEVFARLAREARKVAGRESLLGWLHTQARCRAIDAVRGEERRRRREHEATTMHDIAAEPDAQWEKLRSWMDEALSQLRDRDREAVLLRFFQGHSHQEVGRVLGLSENAAQKRVDRALEKLRANFARRGVAIPCAALAAAMAAHSVKAAPAGFSENLADVSLAQAQTTAVGGTSLFFLLMSTKLKIVLPAVILLILVFFIAVNWPSSRPTGGSTRPSATPDAGPPTALSTSTTRSATATRIGLPVVARAPTATSSANDTPIVAGPKADLPSLIAAGIYFMEVNDLASLVKTTNPPGVQKNLRQNGYGQTEEEMAANLRGQRNEDRLLAEQLAEFRIIQDMTPMVSLDGKRATYNYTYPESMYVVKERVATFIKVNGYWYYGDGTDEDKNAPP